MYPPHTKPYGVSTNRWLMRPGMVPTTSRSHGRILSSYRAPTAGVEPSGLGNTSIFPTVMRPSRSACGNCCWTKVGRVPKARPPKAAPASLKKSRRDKLGRGSGEEVMGERSAAVSSGGALEWRQLDIQLPRLNSGLELVKRPRRRTADVLPQDVEVPVVARADIVLQVGVPVHVAGEVRADVREHAHRRIVLADDKDSIAHACPLPAVHLRPRELEES